MPFVVHTSPDRCDLTDQELLFALQRDEEWALDEVIDRIVATTPVPVPASDD